MKNSLSVVVTGVFVTFMMIIIVCIMNAFSVMNNANAFHNMAIAELQASNFSTSTQAKMKDLASGYGFEISFTNKTNESVNEAEFVGENDNLDRLGRVWQVTTKYRVIIPIVNFDITQELVGFAR